MNGEPNIADLIRKLRDDVLSLVSEEVTLAKTEVSEKLSQTGRNIGYLAVGGLIASSGLVMALMAFGYLLGELFARRGFEAGTATFLGFIVVAILVGIASGMIITKALTSLRSDSIKPDKTLQSLREDKQWAQTKI